MQLSEGEVLDDPILPCSDDSDRIVPAVEQVLCVVQPRTGEPHRDFGDRAVLKNPGLSTGA